MPEMVTGNPEFRLTGIILHTLLNATNGDGIPRTGSFFDQKDLFGFGRWSHPEIACQSKQSVMTHIDDPILGPLSIFDDDFLLLEVQHTQCEMSDFLHAKATPEHQHEHGSIPISLHNVKKDVHLLIPQVFGERLGHLENVTPPNGIHDG
jgi:hypothetical protein